MNSAKINEDEKQNPVLNVLFFFFFLPIYPFGQLAEFLNKPCPAHVRLLLVRFLKSSRKSKKITSFSAKERAPFLLNQAQVLKNTGPCDLLHDASGPVEVLYIVGDFASSQTCRESDQILNRLKTHGGQPKK